MILSPCLEPLGRNYSACLGRLGLVQCGQEGATSEVFAVPSQLVTRSYENS